MSSIAGGDLINGSARASPFVQSPSVTASIGATPGTFLTVAGATVNVNGSTPSANQALVASSSTAASFANVVNSLSGGTTGLTPSSASTGALVLAGTLGLANGGTNATLTATNGGVVWSNATQLQVSAAGSANQILTSNGAAAPSWITFAPVDLQSIGVVNVLTTSTAVVTINTQVGVWVKLSLFVSGASSHGITLSVSNTTSAVGYVVANAGVATSLGATSPATDFNTGGYGGLWEMLILPSATTVAVTATSATASQNVTFGGMVYYM